MAQSTALFSLKPFSRLRISQTWNTIAQTEQRPTLKFYANNLLFSAFSTRSLKSWHGVCYIMGYKQNGPTEKTPDLTWAYTIA